MAIGGAADHTLVATETMLVLLVDSINRKWTVRHRVQSPGILLSADYKEVALSAPTGTLRANVARQEDVECNTSRKISSAGFVI
jgi:hypothetical protein